MNYVGVTVVIPCFNCEDTIGRAIDSVLSQTLIPNEIILIDDSSSDQTLSILNIYKEKFCDLITLVRLETNSGASVARNFGIKFARNNLIAFLDSDDTWHPNKIEIQANLMLSDSSIILSGHRVKLWEPDSKKSDSDGVNLKKITLNKLLFKNYFNTPSVMIRNCGLQFPSDQRYAEDFKLWLDIAKSGKQLVLIDQVLAYIYKPFYGAGGLSASIFKMHYFEQKNLFNVLLSGATNPLIVFLSIIFAGFKFLRRLILIPKRQLMKNR